VDGAAVVVRLAGDPVFGEVADGSGVGLLSGAVAGSVVLASGGNPVTVALTPMLKLVAVGEPGTVEVVRGGVEG